MARNDDLGDSIYMRYFEVAEYSFVSRYLHSGMIALDVGAHHGLYTTLAAIRVGNRGRVIAFEPSPRERRWLQWHVRLNRLTNIVVEAVALGETNGESDLYLVNGRETGCNSLREPNVSEPTKRVPVLVRSLDHYLENERVATVNFVKIDTEGAELSILKGGSRMLRRDRPVIMCEVQDVRTRPWGYRAREILGFLEGFGYTWWVPQPSGEIEPLSVDRTDHIHGTYVAIPTEGGAR